MSVAPREPKRLSPEAVVLGAFAGVVMPAACFMTAANWQPFRGHPDTAELLLEPLLFVAFVPLMVYALISMALALIDLPRFGRRFAIRFGLGTGIVLTAQYVVVLWKCLVSVPYAPREVETILTVGALSAASALLLFALWVLARDRLGRRVAFLFAIAAAAVGVVVFGPGFEPPPPFYLCLIVLGSAPAWCLITFLSIAVWTVARVPGEPTRGRMKALLIGGWLVACAAAWAYSAAMISGLKAGTITLSH